MFVVIVLVWYVILSETSTPYTMASNMTPVPSNLISRLFDGCGVRLMVAGGPVENSARESEGGLQSPDLRAFVLQEA